MIRSNLQSWSGGWSRQAKGCEALIDVWKLLRGRLENDCIWQSQDRLKAVRMLGKQPVDAAEDQRVRLIYTASFALEPAR